MIMLAFKTWIARFFSLFYTSEEVLISSIQHLKRSLKRGSIHFLQPQKFLFQCRQLLILLEACGSFSCFLILLHSLRKKVIEHKPATAKGTLD